MKLLIVAGGGGHSSAALSVIQSLPKTVKVLFVGRKYALEGDSALSLEYQIAKDKNISFVPITMGRLQRKFTIHTIFSLFKIPSGFLQSFIVLIKFKPDVVLSFGGYVSIPIVVLAFIFRIPVVIHEQTLGVGLANKIGSFFAKKICISWDRSFAFFPKEKTILTGNPIRKEIKKVESSKIKVQHVDNLPLVYITGGSSGSHAINVLIEGSIENFLKNFTVIHQTGDSQEFKDYDRLVDLRKKLPENLQKRYNLTKFLQAEEVGKILKQSDIVISRSGINIVSELLYLKKVAFLIPLSYAGRSEQLENARFFKDSGLGEYELQENLTSKSLYDRILEMQKNLSTYRGKDIAIVDNAEENIIKIVMELCNGGHQNEINHL